MEDANQSFHEQVIRSYDWWFSNPDFLDGNYAVVDTLKAPEMILAILVQVIQERLNVHLEWEWVLDTTEFENLMFQWEAV